MTKQTIAIDIDDVIAAHVEAFVLYSNSNFGTSLSPEDYREHWSELWRVGHDEVERRALKFHAESSVAYYDHFQEAPAALSELSRHFNLVVVTARRKIDVEATHEWLKRHFPGVFSDIHFVPIWEPDNTTTKADICHQINAEYLIDDLPRHCNVAARGGIKALLFGNYSWNRSESIEPGVERVHTWQKVLEFFNVELQ